MKRQTRGTITATEAHKEFFSLIEQVNQDRTPVRITSRRGDAVLMARAEYDALEETAYLLRAPANVRRLVESIQQASSSRTAPSSSDRTPQPGTAQK